MKNQQTPLCLLMLSMMLPQLNYSQATEFILENVTAAKQIEVLDINNDQLDDIIYSSGSQLYVKYKTGSLTFDAPVSIASGAMERFEFVDTDKDGDLDLLRAGGNDIFLHEHVGDQFEPGDEIGFVIGVKDFFVGDFNGDQWPDVVAGAGTDGLTNDKRLIYLQNQQNNDFAIDVLGTGLSFIWRVEGIDADEDHDLDILVNYSSQDIIRLYLNDGQGNFTLSDEMMADVPDGINTLETIDLNNDTYPDLVVGIVDWDNSPLYVFYNLPDLDWSRTTLRDFEHTGSYGSVTTKVVDFDQDGDRDIYYTNSYHSEVHVVINQSSGVPEDSLIYNDSDWGRIIQAIGAGKVNGDNRLDPVYYSYTSTEKYLATFIDLSSPTADIEVDTRSLVCFPNPSVNQFSLSHIFDTNDIFNITAFDVMGKSFPLERDHGTLQIRHALPPGWYFIRVETSHGPYLTNMVVKATQ